MAQQTRSPFAKSIEMSANRHWLRFSMGSMLLAIFVFSAMGGALYYAVRVPMIRAEFVAILGETSVIETVSKDRSEHLRFLLYCYSAPLLLTGLIGLGVSLLRAVESRRAELGRTEEAAWDADFKGPELEDPIAPQFRITKPSDR